MKNNPQTVSIVNIIKKRYDEFQSNKRFNPYYMLGFDEETISLKIIQKRFRAIALYFHDDRQPSTLEKEMWLFLANVKELLSNVAKNDGSNKPWQTDFESTECRFTDKISMQCAALHRGKLALFQPSSSSFAETPTPPPTFEALCKALRNNPEAFCAKLNKPDGYRALRSITRYEQLFALLNQAHHQPNIICFILKHFFRYSSLEDNPRACFLSPHYSSQLKAQILWASDVRRSLSQADIVAIIAQTRDKKCIDLILWHCFDENIPKPGTKKFKDYWRAWCGLNKPLAFDLLCQCADERVQRLVIAHFARRGSRVLLDWLDYQEYRVYEGQSKKLPAPIRAMIVRAIIHQRKYLAYYLREPRDFAILAPYLPVERMVLALDNLKQGEWVNIAFCPGHLFAERVNYGHHRALIKAFLERGLVDYLAQPVVAAWGGDHSSLLSSNLAVLLTKQHALLSQQEEQLITPQARKTFNQLAQLQAKAAKQEKVLKDALKCLDKRVTLDKPYDRQQYGKKRSALQSALLGVQYTQYTLGEMALNLIQPLEESLPSNTSGLGNMLANFEQRQTRFRQKIKHYALDHEVNAFSLPIRQAVGIVKDIVLLFTGLGTASIIIRGLLSPITYDANWHMGAFSSMGSQTKRLVSSTHAKMAFFQKEMQKIVVQAEAHPQRELLSSETRHNNSSVSTR
ncbi:MAG: hypothetical protein K2Q14_06385 [Gammaproteobacteria bacterium]|nr:hypothetical protein [Gammaproteobacteria bacterium]